MKKNANSTKTSLVISVVFHTVLILFVTVFAAREGMLGKTLKTLAVTMIPKEKPPEPPKEKPPEEKPEPPKEEPKVAKIEPPAQPKAPAQDPAANKAAAPPAAVAAPTAVAVPSFDFAGGKEVVSTDDPGAIYKQWVEYSLRTKWVRPENVNDRNFAAEVWLYIDTAGRIEKSEWQKPSGDKNWDRSVQVVLDGAKSFNRPPPKDFPNKVLVRFDVEEQQVIE